MKELMDNNEMLSKVPIVQQEIAREFETQLAILRLKFQDTIIKVDPLENKIFRNQIEMFNQDLIIFQYRFLQYLASNGLMESDDCPTNFNPKIPSVFHIPELITGSLSGSTGAYLVTLIPGTTSGFWFWTTELTAVQVAAAAVGVSASVVIASAGALIAAGSMLLVNKVLKDRRRYSIRKKVLNNFDKEVVPQLKVWVQRYVN